LVIVSLWLIYIAVGVMHTPNIKNYLTILRQCTEKCP